MPSRPRLAVRPRRLLAAGVACLTCALGLPAAAQADKSMEASFQDDNLLIFNTPQGRADTLNRLADLGVDRLRISVFWQTVAPQPDSQQRPAGFNAADPNAYPPGTWDRYDQIVRLARQRGIDVHFNITSPAPKWATADPGREDIDKTHEPSPAEFQAFVRAVGLRYNGAFPDASGATVPRVTFWSIWNEPNQAGWLTPQWRPDPRRGRGSGSVEAAPAIYRSLVDAAWNGLQATSHGRDTILIGETAPKGLGNRRGVTRSMDILRFLRSVYCLDVNGRILEGSAATARGCPARPDREAFRTAHPGLFASSGWAHHPYELNFAPGRRPASDEWVTTANLGDLQSELRRAYQRYGAGFPSRDGVPIFLTEFGYQTAPPDPVGVSNARQEEYINEAEYIAWSKPYVRSFSQFLLVDDKPLPGVDTRTARAWGKTFQSGLMTLEGKEKPAYDAYRVGFHLDDDRVDRGDAVSVWGIARPETRGVIPIEVQVRTRSYRGKPTRYVKRATGQAGRPRHYMRASFTARRDGWIRLRWTDASGRAFHSQSHFLEVDDGRGRD
ncbi:MAG TPA: hypothetical protein VGV40_05430 [Solirubrobacteraceae bacterium]|nr:hypothetical protein [Solirubrobacteraceae bacterium]